MSKPASRAAVIRAPFGKACRDTRISLDLSQREIAARAGVTRGHIARVERGQANLSIDLVVAIADALGLELELIARPPILVGQKGQQRDHVHALCSGHVDRRLRAAGWQTAREVEVIHGRSHGWIDLLAYDARTATLLIIEIKTRLDDLGAIERQLGWYERSVWALARDLGWEPRRVVACLLVLASDEVDAAIRRNREVLGPAFPMRAPELLAAIVEPDRFRAGGRALAMVDPRHRGEVWLIRSRVDGRRSPARYADYAAAASIRSRGSPRRS